jgi:outer membrane receptor protein involved in Fe transport
VAAYAVVDGSPGAKFTAVSGGSAVPCPGVTVPVTVAQYTFVDGVGTLTGTWTTSLDARHTRVAISLPPTCGTWLELYDVTEGALPSALTQGEIDDPQPGGGLWDGKRGHSAVVKNGVVPCPPQSPSGVPSGVPIS